MDKVVQVVPNGAQSDSKGVQRVPKWSQNAAQGLQNVGPKLAEKEKHRRKRKRKRRRRRKRKKQNKRKRTWNCQHITIYLQVGGIPLRYIYYNIHTLRTGRTTKWQSHRIVSFSAESMFGLSTCMCTLRVCIQTPQQSDESKKQRMRSFVHVIFKSVSTFVRVYTIRTHFTISKSFMNICVYVSSLVA